MEKKRRARINQSLNELKNLILEAMKKDVSHKMLCIAHWNTYMYDWLPSEIENKIFFFTQTVVHAACTVFQEYKLLCLISFMQRKCNRLV